MLKYRSGNLNTVIEKKSELDDRPSDNHQPHMMVTDIAMHFDDLDDLDLYYGINKSPNMKTMDRIKYWM